MARIVAALAALSLAPWLQAQPVPKVSAVSPPNGATGESISTKVVFTFDQAMSTMFPPFATIPGVMVGNIEWTPAGMSFGYLWSGDGKTLTCTAFSDLPANTTITWRLNPAGTLLPFTSAADKALATTTGSFQTGSGGGGDCDPAGIPGDWGACLVFKQGYYVQHSAAAPPPAPETPFAFMATVRSPLGGPGVTGGSITFPSGTQAVLQDIYIDTPPTQEALDQSYPAGAYTVRFTQDGTGTHTVPMNMPAGPPPVPHFANYEQARQIDVAQPFTLRWDAFTGAGANDVQVLIVTDGSGETVFMAPDLCVPRELPLSATSIVIPAGTLQDNQTYTAGLAFLQRFYFSSDVGTKMAGNGMVSRNTEMTLRTGTGGTADPAEFTGFQMLPNGDPELMLAGTPGAVYAIQRTGSLEGLATDWRQVGMVTMSGDGTATFEDTTPGKSLPLYYRAIAE